ncbi:MAG: hypothetical protein HOF75_05690 [Flavobacteriaceae bacterium]|jgi:hypothetical protein|nr:hypothetical protein [Flavobacteriaceae bacterium]MBT3919764.1 hypothetical protein [Flavobacteriaceae bacterium]MBT6704542.1 hypothetical protein [Flavobacteriaceae bacterium]|tara:strand:+ start:1067 stop:1267 length:201 start_codon:yes stop_codon:yes gene_type:complete
MNGTEIDLNNLSSYWKYHSKKLKRSLGFYLHLVTGDFFYKQLIERRVLSKQNIILRNQLPKDGKQF